MDPSTHSHGPRARVLIVFGGRSSEHDVSLRSASSVLAHLDRDRFAPILLGVRRDGSFCVDPTPDTPTRSLAEIVETGVDIADLRSLAPDLVFPVLHGPYGEDGTFQGMLEVLGLPYVGSGVLASALCMDKSMFKHTLRALAPEIPFVPSIDLDLQATADELDQLVAPILAATGLPCFVKPANQGSSIGISRAESSDELIEALALAARYDHKLVVERAVECREIELAILGDGGPETLVSAPGEIVLPEGAWYDYDNKYTHDVARLQIPAELPAETSARLQELALRAFRAAGCHGLARVDFFVDRRTLAPYLNEVNTMPGFTSISMYPRLLEHTGLSYRELLTRLCELGRARHAARRALRVTR
jgi:D-alanine-D-alanine ligase